MSQVLTMAQAAAFAVEANRVIVRKCGDTYIFTDSHCVRLPDGSQLGADWVPITTYLPTTAVPREGCPDGIICDLPTYLAVYHKGCKLLETEAELLAAIDYQEVGPFFADDGIPIIINGEWIK